MITDYRSKPSSTRLCLKSRDEVFFVDLARTLYIKADDHYAHVYYASGVHFMVPFSLGRIEELIITTLGADSFMRRMGRKYVVNTLRIFSANTVREQLCLVDDQGKTETIHVPKLVLRELIDDMTQ